MTHSGTVEGGDRGARRFVHTAGAFRSHSAAGRARTRVRAPRITAPGGRRVESEGPDSRDGARVRLAVDGARRHEPSRQAIHRDRDAPPDHRSRSRTGRERLLVPVAGVPQASGARQGGARLTFGTGAEDPRSAPEWSAPGVVSHRVRTRRPATVRQLVDGDCRNSATRVVISRQPASGFCECSPRSKGWRASGAGVPRNAGAPRQNCPRRPLRAQRAIAAPPRYEGPFRGCP